MSSSTPLIATTTPNSSELIIGCKKQYPAAMPIITIHSKMNKHSQPVRPGQKKRPHDQSTSSTTEHGKTHHNDKKEKKEKDAEAKKKASEKQARYRERKIYEDQIETIGDYKGKVTEVDVWIGDRVYGSFRRFTQMSKFGKVRNKAPVQRCKNGNIKSTKPTIFEGAVVAIGDPTDRKYLAVPRPNFKVKVPCYAKHADHATAKPITGHRLTGACARVSGVSTKLFVLVQWENNETKWVASDRVQDMELGEKKRAIPPSTVEPNDKPHTPGDIQKVNSYYYPITFFIKANPFTFFIKAKTVAEDGKANETEDKGKEANEENVARDFIKAKIVAEDGKAPTTSQLKEWCNEYHAIIEANRIMESDTSGVSSTPAPPLQCLTQYRHHLYMT